MIPYFAAFFCFSSAENSTIWFEPIVSYSQEINTDFLDTNLSIDLDGNSYFVNENHRSDSTLVKFDPNGTRLWTKRVTAGERLIGAGEGVVYFASYSKPNLTLQKFDADGKLLWERTVAHHLQFKAVLVKLRQLFVHHDNSLTITLEDDVSKDEAKSTFLHFDGEGNLLWDWNHTSHWANADEILGDPESDHFFSIKWELDLPKRIYILSLLKFGPTGFLWEKKISETPSENFSFPAYETYRKQGGVVLLIGKEKQVYATLVNYDAEIEAEIPIWDSFPEYEYEAIPSVSLSPEGDWSIMLSRNLNDDDNRKICEIVKIDWKNKKKDSLWKNTTEMNCDNISEHPKTGRTAFTEQSYWPQRKMNVYELLSDKSTKLLASFETFIPNGYKQVTIDTYNSDQMRFDPAGNGFVGVFSASPIGNGKLQHMVEHGFRIGTAPIR